MKTLPYDLLNVEPFPTAFKLESLYHVGQDRIWDGKKVLSFLVEKHGVPKLSDEKAEAFRELFAVLLWGEMAAWNISSALSFNLDSFEAKLAAVAQAHDESRHFYVIKDYLALLGPVPGRLRPRSNQLLEAVLNANTTGKMLVGMQLMIEPMALTLFKLVRKLEPDPVLEGLLELIEKDEARHVGLGTLFLPEVLKHMSFTEKADLAAWQMRMYLLQFKMMKEMLPVFEKLGISAREVFEQGRKKQVVALKMLMDEMDERIPIVEKMLQVIDFKAELEFPESKSTWLQRVVKGTGAAKKAVEDLR